MTCSASYLLYYTSMDLWNVPMHLCVCVLDFTYVNMYDMMVSKSVSTSTCIVTPDSLSPSPSTSAPMTTPDPPVLIFQHPEQKQNRLQTDREGPIMALNQQL